MAGDLFALGEELGLGQPGVHNPEGIGPVEIVFARYRQTCWPDFGIRMKASRGAPGSKGSITLSKSEDQAIIFFVPAQKEIHNYNRSCGSSVSTKCS